MDRGRSRVWPATDRGPCLRRGQIALVRTGCSGSSVGWRSLYPQLLQPAAQRAGRYPQAHSRAIGTLDMPIRQCEDLQNMLSFEIFEPSRRRRRDGGVLWTQRRFVDPQHRLVRKNHRALNDIFQFTDIAWPCVVNQLVEGVLVYLLARTLEFHTVLFEEMLSQ